MRLLSIMANSVAYTVLFCPKHDDFTLQQKKFNSWAFKLKKIKQKGTSTLMCIVGHELQHTLTFLLCGKFDHFPGTQLIYMKMKHDTQ